MRLYRGFTSQEELDREYNPSAAVADSGERTAGWARRSAAARREQEVALGLKYGPTREEYLDVFPAGPNAPVHVFIHGGYWRRFSARDHSFVAPRLVAAGITTVVVNYALCPGVTLDEIVRQCRAALAWTFDEIGGHGGDPSRITVSGHSAGGHLTAMAMLTDWPGDYERPADLVKAGVAISGLFDLAPFPFTFIQPAVQFTWDQIRRNSPLWLLPERAKPLHVAVGGAESFEFLRQARDFHAAWRGTGLAGELLECADCNHFTVLEELERAGSPLLELVIATARAA